ncbi:ABC transporter ATP-binding protein [Margalitia sp. FSL K6-0131]|uniref:ABC transporter ATP-binding protein n=1 Tax=Margalitia sp. FSL K6-0131 TaxID=2954604 RepID=UPI0030FB90E7
MSQIQLCNISKSFQGSFVFKNVDLKGEAGQIIAIRGKSGVGKSTLLNIIAGLELPTSGSYQLDAINMGDKNINELARIRGEKIGYISQFSPMVPNLTAFENICIPLLLINQNDDIIDSRMKRIEELSKLFEIQDLLHKKVNKLSGGEIQRVGIIRSLVNEPSIIVADEPTGSLDDETASNILDYFHTLKLEGIIIILATHSKMVSDHSDIVYNLTKDGLILEK